MGQTFKDIEILFENDDIFVVQKPAGMASARRSARESGEPSCESIFSNKCSLLHRLDTSTSGALAFGKSPQKVAHYREIWNQRVTKIYRAWVSPLRAGMNLPILPFTITWPIGHSA